ncbi:MAG: hypothetical protein L0Z70_11635, partial [Chloroflexi bacterium]|nr:hypothetical protein [Chloroflexota bacterium]
MDAIKEQFRKPLVIGAVALVLGLLLGLFYGWVIQPVEWTDAPVEKLRPDLQEEYLRMAIDSYVVNQDAALAKSRYAQLGEGGAAQLGLIKANPGLQNPQAIAAFETTVTGAASAIPTAPAAGEDTAEKPASSGWTRVLLPLMCVIVLGVALAVYFLFFRTRRGG